MKVAGCDINRVCLSVADSDPAYAMISIQIWFFITTIERHFFNLLVRYIKNNQLFLKFTVSL
jgi:hypothetical protein